MELEKLKKGIVKITNSVEQTKKLAEDFAKIVKPFSLVAFFADLGAGKTVFVKGFAKNFGIEEDVFSPSFSIINEYSYSDEKKLVHCDFYRLFSNSEEDVYNTGFFDHLNQKDTIVLVEWAEKILNFLPESYFKVEIKSLTLTTREIKICLEKKNESFSS